MIIHLDYRTDGPTKKLKTTNDNTSNIQYVQQYIDGVPDAPRLPTVCEEAVLSCEPLPQPPPGSSGKYFFPPPWIMGTSNLNQSYRYYHNYIRIREYCLRRCYSEDFDDLPRKTEYWREALRGNYIQSKGLNILQTSQALLTMNDTVPLSTSEAKVVTKRCKAWGRPGLRP